MADAHAILDGVEALNPTISHAVDQIISKNTFFRDQPIYSLVYPAISALVKQDLNSVQGSASKFLATTVGFVPVRVPFLNHITSIFAYLQILVRRIWFLKPSLSKDLSTMRSPKLLMLTLRSRWFMDMSVLVRCVEFRTTFSISLR